MSLTHKDFLLLLCAVHFQLFMFYFKLLSHVTQASGKKSANEGGEWYTTLICMSAKKIKVVHPLKYDVTENCILA